MFSLDVSCDDEIKSGLAAVRHIHPFATHLVYAYHYNDPITGHDFSGNSDDGEWGASKLVAEQLAENTRNKLVVVVRYFGGTYLGKRRFDIYSNAARQAAQQ